MASFYWCRKYNFLLRSWERIRKSFTWPFVYGPFSCYCYCVLRAYSCALTARKLPLVASQGLAGVAPAPLTPSGQGGLLW